MARALRQKGCVVTGIDETHPPDDSGFARFIQADLSAGELPVDPGAFDYVLLLDVIEHLRSPEALVDSLRRAGGPGAGPRVIVSTGNVAFFVARIMLLFGRFHYGPRGILDLTHTRLFTFASVRHLFEQAGFVVDEVRGIPAPFSFALGEKRYARALFAINRMLIRVWRSLFAYQIYMVARPRPTLERLLERAEETSRSRIAEMRRS